MLCLILAIIYTDICTSENSHKGSLLRGEEDWTENPPKKVSIVFLSLLEFIKKQCYKQVYV